MERSKDVYATYGKMVDSTLYKNSVFFLPFIYDSNVNIDAKAAFIGLQNDHTIADMMRIPRISANICIQTSERVAPPAIRTTDGLKSKKRKKHKV